MNNDERDNIMIEMHRDVGVLCERMVGVCERIDEHHTTLYGKDGVVAELLLVKDRQAGCPARKATTTAGKRLTVSVVMMVVGVLSFVAVVVFSIWK